jgi:Xaa-Pro aminopeptidase
MTRTFAVGTPDPEIATWHEHTREALELSRELVRPGADGADVFREACRLYEGHGYPTSLSKPEGTVLRDGFNHALGHGVGLDVHEAPTLGKVGHELVAGDVITLEPGLYRHGFGGVRLEDVVLVTDDGCDTLTRFPYDLDPRETMVETAR